MQTGVVLCDLELLSSLFLFFSENLGRRNSSYPTNYTIICSIQLLLVHMIWFSL